MIVYFVTAACPPFLIIQSNHNRTTNKNYRNAKRYSNYALGLVLANIIYTLLLGVILTGVAVGIGSRCYNCYYYYG